MAQLVDDPIAAGREAARRHDWIEAYELLSTAESGLSGDDLEQLADAAYFSGRLSEALELRERIFKEHLDEGSRLRAAGAAVRLSVDYMMKAAVPLANGWLAKGDRLLAEEPESREHGQAALAHAMQAETLGKIDEELEHAERAFEIGRRFGDPDLQALALVAQGAALLYKGGLDRGLALLDEASTSALTGELEPFSACIVYCMTISGSQGIGDFERARQWTDAATRLADSVNAHGFPGACRIHRSEILWLGGFWEEAEREAVNACGELESYNVFTTASGHYQIGEIRRRRGDFAAAEEAYRKAHELGREPQPGQALLRLAQGKAAEAEAALNRSLGEGGKDPLARARRLPAQVDVSLAAGEIRRAREAAAELERIADEYRVDGRRTPAREGTVQLVWGRIRLAEHDWEGAASALRAARQTWDRIGAPYEAAQARMLLGVAYRGEGDEDGAREEVTAARTTFERLGAALDLQRAAELLGESRTRRTFMFTDIVDSTKLVDALGEDKWRKLLTWHDRRLRELIEQAGGEVIKQTGDGYFAAFQTPEAAVEAAAGIQRG